MSKFQAHHVRDTTGHGYRCYWITDSGTALYCSDNSTSNNCAHVPCIYQYEYQVCSARYAVLAELSYSVAERAPGTSRKFAAGWDALLVYITRDLHDLSHRRICPASIPAKKSLLSVCPRETKEHGGGHLGRFLPFFLCSPMNEQSKNDHKQNQPSTRGQLRTAVRSK